jgi:hypothetical protein
MLGVKLHFGVKFDPRTTFWGSFWVYCFCSYIYSYILVKNTYEFIYAIKFPNYQFGGVGRFIYLLLIDD